ncbi:unnamed protein product [Durusdinium trenchii]|uniref:Uncharacterized protein n=1 Tax=Durusdinium trenchii TaxID=1381693 RepID=A0ABP0PIV5_9DINO
MAKMNDLGHLLGGHSLQSACGILLDFWSKYRALFPQHELRRDVDAGLKPLSHCLPILFHGDEGVTYRKSGLLVLSIQGIFGHGSSKRDENFRGATQGIPLNFLRTGFQTRLLVCVCPKELYSDDPRVWNAIFEVVVADLARCQKEGIAIGSGQEKVFPILLGNKGDWSYLVSSANLERSYRRAPKGARDDDHNVSGAGICHLCTCGQGVDWEDLNAAEAEMERSFVEELPPPWFRECAMTRELLVDRSPNGKARFHLIDPWHTLHLGVGKSWVACGIMMIQKFLPESQMDARISFIGSRYKNFCKRKKLDPVLRKIDWRTFGSATEPSGCWNKAAVTSNFMMFLEEFCEEHRDVLQGDERLRVFAAGTMRANEFMRGIYSHDVLIPRDSAMYLSNCLQDFFKAYLFQAAAAYNLGLAYFGLFPKLHAVHELSFHLKKDAQRAGYVMNPAVFSCSMDEDFIGRCAAVSRCVSPRIMSKRTLERYLCHIQCAWARN